MLEKSGNSTGHTAKKGECEAVQPQNPWVMSPADKMKATYKGKEEERMHHRNYSFAPDETFRFVLSMDQGALGVHSITFKQKSAPKST